MTCCRMTEEVISVVAVPYSGKSYVLASKWAEFNQITAVGIRFYLVREDGEIVIIWHEIWKWVWDTILLKKVSIKKSSFASEAGFFR